MTICLVMGGMYVCIGPGHDHASRVIAIVADTSGSGYVFSA